ncbi:MAG: 6-bladed beta-propeller [Acidobacteriota bacterium]
MMIRTHTPTRTVRLSLLAAIVAIAISGMAPRIEARQDKASAKQKQASASPTDRLPVWPLPPETPRIRYVRSYHGLSDFKTKKAPKWKALLLGDDPSDQKPLDALVKPYGIAVSRIGRVYVTDTVARRVFVFDPEAKTLSFLGEAGTAKLTKPIGVAVDADDHVFVADATVNRVFGYGLDGHLFMAIGREGELDNPSGLAIDRVRNLLYVADAKKHHVLCYSTKDGSSVRTIGKRGGAPGEFNFPTNLFVDGRGQLYVTDTMNFRIQVFDTEGAFVSEFGTQGDTPGSLNRPKGVGVDSEGHVYVVDSSFNNFQAFDANGQLLLFVGSVGRAPGEFFLPAGLYVDDHDQIYVADQGNARVQVFEYLKAGVR